MRLFPLSTLLLAAVPALTFSDSVRPIQFGPYFVNHVTYTGNPASYRYALNNVNYRFQVGWIEPISENSHGIFKDAYFETDGDFNVSPFQSDVGTNFNLKPIRYLEFGLGYSRLMYHNSLAANNFTGNGGIPMEKFRPATLLELDREFGGADIFTFQTNLTVDLGPTQLFMKASAALWDVESNKDLVYEYGSDLIISRQDRINTYLLRWSLDLSRYSKSRAYSFTGAAIRNQYWHTRDTHQEKNLVSLGFTGFRPGRNSNRQRGGLDVNLGYWTRHPQLSADDWVKSLTFLLEWKWNIQFLKV